MRKTRLILGAFVAAATLACTGCGEDADSTANVDLEAMTSEAETTPEEEPEVIVKTSIVTEIVVKPATETETVANATPAATAAPAANTTTGDIYTDVIAQYRIASDKEVYPYSYAMADLNLDGYPELMVKTGNCEANYVYEIWTKGADGKAVKIGTARGFHSQLYYNDQTGLLYSNMCIQDAQSISSYAMVSGTLQETLLCDWGLRDSDYYRQNGYYDLTRMDHVFLLVENDINDYVFQNSALQSGNDSAMTIDEYAAHVNGASSNQNQSEEDKHLVTEAPQQQETTPPAAAASEDTLKEQVLSKCGNSPLDWYYDDFDGDGNKEAFAMAYRDNGMGGHEILGLFYVNAQGTVTDLGTDFWGACGAGRVVAYNSSKKFFVFDTNNGGSGSTDYLYGVTNGACYSSNLSGSLHGFQVDENGAYTFEGGSAAHEHPQIRLTYDESTGDFHQ
ncbi:MAG: hypothetical protein MR466_07230 [Ruminococcus sp.]|nr:hypothetical protein [Ruminococcus sp.]